MEMLELMKHRSPDGMNISTGDFALGMGRLAILDVNNAEFPMMREGYTLAFNGEIFNYEELRALLAFHKKVTFTTETDTEVLLWAFVKWGEKCLDQLNGMFAFAVRKPNGQIFLARDHSGEKPLYYQVGPFKFASEAKALDYPIELKRGYALLHTGGKEGGSKVFQWYKPKKVVIQDDPVAQLDTLLGQAVQLRTRSHVPYALYLSDGIDSNLIRTYHHFDQTLTFTEKRDRGRDFRQCFEQIVYHLDFPVAHYSAYALYKLAQQAHEKGIKVVLSGDGADELFGGYVRYVGNEFNKHVQEIYPSYKSMYPYRDMMRQEFDGNMQELLRMADRMASAWGVENRSPFLDRNIIEFAWSLPTKWKVEGTNTKIILRELLRRRDPSHVFTEKHGLRVPIGRWIGAEGLDKTKYIEMQRSICRKFQSSTRTGRKMKSVPE